MSGRRLTRREFAAGAAAAAALAGALCQSSVAGAADSLGNTVAPAPTALPRGRARKLVVSFHLDRPYVDCSGEAVPYVPPAGARSAQALAGLSEEDLFRLPL